MQVVGGAERSVIQAIDAERLAQVFFESVQGLQLSCESGRFTSAFHAPNLLEARIHELRDVFSNYPPRALDVRHPPCAFGDPGGAVFFAYLNSPAGLCTG